ncbi:MAG TPA: FAD-dependent oxidoreductase [Pirellulaceae bacterium]|nr:FAD-dependent oxidoreductase [Pirellulaceae bacterium]
MSLELSRRELLASLLGLPLAALVGCDGSAARLPLQGEIIGAAHNLGHRLRDRAARSLPDSSLEPQEIVIVGGGIAGLSAAWRLKQAGVTNFTLLELEEAAGGTSRSGTMNGFAHPWGAHYLPAPTRENKALLRLLEAMGMVDGHDAAGAPIFGEQYLCRDPEERLFANGQWEEGLFPESLTSEADRAQFERFQAEVMRWVRWRDADGRQAFAIPTAHCSKAAEMVALDRLSMTQWLDERQLDSPRLRWWIDYACRDDYGLRASETSAWAGLFYFAARTQADDATSQPLLTWPEGNGRLANYLANEVRSHLHVGEAAAQLRCDEQHVNVLALQADGADVGYRASQVIFAAPHFLAPYVIADWPEGRRADTSTFRYGAWLVANLYLRARPANRGFAPCWDNVLLDSASLGYVVATHQLGLDHGPTVWTYYYPLCDLEPSAARTQLLELRWQDWAEFVLTDLEQAHPEIRDLVERLDVMHWGHAMIRPGVGFLWGGAREREAKPHGSIHFAHSDLSGVALFEEAFHHGVRAAEEVLTARGEKFSTWL